MAIIAYVGTANVLPPHVWRVRDIPTRHGKWCVHLCVGDRKSRFFWTSCMWRCSWRRLRPMVVIQLSHITFHSRDDCRIAFCLTVCREMKHCRLAKTYWRLKTSYKQCCTELRLLLFIYSWTPKARSGCPGSIRQWTLRLWSYYGSLLRFAKRYSTP